MNWDAIKEIPLPAALALGLIGFLIYAKKRKTRVAVTKRAGNKSYAKNWVQYGRP